MQPSNLSITGITNSVSEISATGSYALTFNFSDIAYNQLDGVKVLLDITN
jgi:hypothetical protein